MRFAFVCTHAGSIGGSYVHVRDCSAALIREGHQVKVFVGGTGPFTESLDSMGVPYYSLTNLTRPIRPDKDWRAIRELQSALTQYQPDLISCHSTKAGMVGRIAGKHAGIPTLFTAHGWTFVDGIPPLQRKLVLAIERYCAKLGPQIICVCDEDRKLALANGIGDPDKFTVVHNGMPDFPDRSDPSTEPPRIVSIARLDSQKDHPTLFNALSQLKDLPWNLDLVGDGERREEYEQMVRGLGIGDRVHFHGSQKNVRPFLSQAHIFALVTNYEGFPRSTLEAMRTGLPVVVTDVNGCKEALIEGETGLTVPLHDVDALAQALRGLLIDPVRRKRMGERGRQRYEDNFTFDAMFAKTKAVYERVLGKPLSP